MPAAALPATPLASGLTGAQITLIAVAAAIPAAALLTLAAPARAPRSRTATLLRSTPRPPIPV
jgi:hypothetical protein